MQLYRNHSSYPLENAQRNLMGRTHYVDPETLRWHKSRVLSSHVVDDGLLFAIVTSDAVDPPSSWTGKTPRRGFRYVIFDLFGTVLERPKLEEAFRRREQASKAMWAKLNAIDAAAVTREAYKRAIKAHADEMYQLECAIAAIEAKKMAVAS